MRSTSALIWLLSISLVLPRETKGQVSFDAASVRKSDPGSAGPPNNCHGGPGTSDPGLLTCTKSALTQLIGSAYNVKAFEILSPSWMTQGGDDGYTLVARIPPGSDKEQFRVMLQRLLAERFRLIVHRETRQLPYYSLVLAKRAPKIALSAGPPPAGPRTAMTFPAGRIHFVMRDLPIGAFANFLTVPLGGPVTDETALKGNYDLDLDFLPDERWPGFGSLPHQTEGANVPTLSQSIEDQLGLRLEARKGPVSVLVVDHAEKVPSEN